jgi:hypothetical protein
MIQRIGEVAPRVDKDKERTWIHLDVLDQISINGLNTY